ncbi:hypothetical protein [Halorubrum ezzemoulense]|uniref:hypothetical protein n=1 Tax=Halorubrum ezzemoulense TaxID=337243 RepID=UPI00232BCA19|nr:hypothetical protein [Halorubrum ezzemoulense]MDB2237059.1 hypothetical protein [Halorubrum ezzemoulense]
MSGESLYVEFYTKWGRKELEETYNEGWDYDEYEEATVELPDGKGGNGPLVYGINLYKMLQSKASKGKPGVGQDLLFLAAHIAQVVAYVWSHDYGPDSYTEVIDYSINELEDIREKNKKARELDEAYMKMRQAGFRRPEELMGDSDE